jgi:hypothetical protein
VSEDHRVALGGKRANLPLELVDLVLAQLEDRYRVFYCRKLAQRNAELGMTAAIWAA